MSYERPEETSGSQPSGGRQLSNDGRDSKADNNDNNGSSGAAGGASATVVVRGETIQEPKSPPNDSQTKGKEKSSPKKVSEAKVKMQSRLPALDDDPDVGVQKDQVVTRDGKADLAFTGTLLASAAPPSAPQGKWQEYRVYETNSGKHVFSKVTRSVFAEEQDEHEAEIFDPAPSSMPSQLLRSARDLVHTQPLTWKNAAADFFGYDPLAKALYRKLGDEFEEHIS
jgi:hypothetical protein